MRCTMLFGMIVFTGCLVLQALPAAEPAAGYSLIEAETNSRAEPSPSDYATEVWLKLIEQGQPPLAANVHPRDAVVLLAAIKTRIDTVLAEGNNHPAFDKESPATIDGFEKLFWSMHVFSNQLTSAGRFYEYAQSLRTIARKYKPLKNDKIDVSILQANWNKTELGDLRLRFAERDRDLRIDRLKLADKVLTEKSDVAERLLAALQLDMDGELLPVLLAKDKTFPTSRLQDVTDTITHARSSAGAALIQKARWLFSGLHWWVRGRYGVGTTGNGLLKNTNALHSPEVMFGLLMPIHTPIPTATNDRNAVPFVDRRHHYLWQFETRQLASGRSETTTTKTQFTPVYGTVTTLTHFY